MKLVFAIIQKEDTKKVSKELNREGYSVTKLSSTGGFLQDGNTTLIVGVEKEKVDHVVSIIEEFSKTRKQMVNPTAASNAMSGMYIGYPMEVSVGGATIFVVDVEKFEKV